MRHNRHHSGQHHSGPGDPLSGAYIEGQNPATPERLPGHTARVPSAPGSAARDPADLRGRPAFLFDSASERAIALTSNGADLPAPAGGGSWRLSGYCTLGETQATPEGPPADAVLQAVSAHGHLVWRKPG